MAQLTVQLKSQLTLAMAYPCNWKVEEAISLTGNVVAVQNRALDEEHLGRPASQHELVTAYHK